MMKFRLLLSSLLLLTAACINEGVVTGNGFVGIEMSAVDAPAAVTHGPLELTRLEVFVSEISFEADGPSGSTSVAQEENTLIDILARTETPPLVPVILRVGSYEAVSLSVELLDDGPGPAIYLEGTLDGVPIRFIFDDAEVFERTTTNLQVADNQETLVLYRLDPDAWFELVDAATLVLGGDGVAEISTTSNSGDYDTVVDRLDTTTEANF